MEIRTLEIDFDRSVLKINGKDYTDRKVVVSLSGEGGWPLEILFNPDQPPYPREEHDSLTVYYEHFNSSIEITKTQESVRRMEIFKSISIDLTKQRFLLNGKPLRDVSELHLDFENGKWSLQVTETKEYNEQRPHEIKE